MTVEELFGPGERAAPMGGEGARVTLASVRDGYVALPLRGVTASRGGFRPAGGLAAETDSDRARSRQIRPIGPLRPVLVVAGCDPALPLLGAPLGLLDPPVGSAGARARAGRRCGWPPPGWCTWPGRTCASRAGATTPARPRRCCPGGGQVIGFCSWQEGLALRPELAEGISGVATDTCRPSLIDGFLAKTGLDLTLRNPPPWRILSCRYTNSWEIPEKIQRTP
jgi:hypothetical protein